MTPINMMVTKVLIGGYLLLHRLQVLERIESALEKYAGMDLTSRGNF